MKKKYRSKYCVGKKEVDTEISKIAAKYSSPGTEEYYRQMLTTVIKLHCDGADSGDLHLLNISLKELRHAFRLFKRFRKIRKVAMFGSARIKPKSGEYKMAAQFAKKISKLGFMVITGGGGGVMEAGNRGSLSGKSFAVNIKLPYEQMPNPYIIKSEKLMTFNYFFTRKLIFIKESDATVLFPGGFGTNDEAFEVLTLAQTGKSAPRPIIFVNGPHTSYWKTWLKFLKKEALKKKLLSAEDFKLFKVVDSVDEAVEEIVKFYKNYHSIRYVKGKLVIRLNKPLSDAQLKELNKKFSSILVKDKIMATGPLPEEIRDKDNLKLPRIVMSFNKRNCGQLFEMVRTINSF